MSMSSSGEGLSWRDEALFLATNRLPRHALSRAMGWLSKIESPLLAKAALAVWRLFDGDFRLDEARKSSFRSIHDIFTRELREGVRPIDARKEVLVSPCDAILGEYGAVEAGRVYQAKGFPYQLADLIPDHALAEKYRDGCFVTLRLKSSMYHRFHAPSACRIERVFYVSGDRWNVHPPALRKIESLYCKNERAIIECLGEDGGHDLCLVAVAAILVSSIRIHCLDAHQRPSASGLNRFAVSAAAARGDELGYFEHGSTIVLFAPGGWRVCADLERGARLFMGQALLETCEDQR
ncbi:MAG: archaetidylserine decarboxylase [Halieaceae bacterium]|jgi:phosphatidylserine decarboxylase|nr:archaetidylserine decarboxylase [Halieaceae bacterium]